MLRIRWTSSCGHRCACDVGLFCEARFGAWASGFHDIGVEPKDYVFIADMAPKYRHPSKSDSDTAPLYLEPQFQSRYNKDLSDIHIGKMISRDA